MRVNLNAGDWLFWKGKGALNYRGSFANWPDYVARLLSTRHVTDLILLGEERPYHKVAIDAAKARNIAVTVIEMGYLRPDWITVERDGMSSNSRFPNDPGEIRRSARDLPPTVLERSYNQSFFMEALLDLSYNLPNVFLAGLFPGYRRHGLFHPLKEYAGWVRRLLSSSRRRKKADTLIQSMSERKPSYFVYPLQLETDYQLRSHSPYHSQFQAIEEILSSFASHAPPEAELVVKTHPLDNGLLDWERNITEIASRLAVDKRVHYADGGDLAAMIEGCSGMVTVNSTAVLHGLRLGVPAKVLGAAIYDVDGMTDQGHLDRFWMAPRAPDSALTEDFYRLLAASIQVKGNFYSQRGTDAAADAISQRLLGCRVNFPGGDCGRVPRFRPLKKPVVERRVASLAQSTTKSC
nr:capsular biosynthesis protein [Agrobacterium sp. rho-13.3]MDX8311738.1 capsular biosynthesis protein [Agrobacterium sp. rho-13.3]